MDDTISRRTFLRAAGGTALAGGLAGLGLLGSEPPAAGATNANSNVEPPLVWVWKFSVDGELAGIRDTIAANGLGVILKTHDGTQWMERYDRSPDAVTGPDQVQRLAAHFEQSGIPFHAWCVVQGVDPIREAHMCAEVMSSGPRSLFLDLEPKEGNNYWQGPWENALIFGQELRRLQPNIWITVAPDARPWQLGAVPIYEFMSFCNAVAPQSYWETFDGPTNHRYLRQHGYSVGPEGFTPELVVEVGWGTFSQFGVRITPIGQGASSPDMWRRFIARASAGGMGPVSLWRYGTSDPAVMGLLGEVVAQERQAAAAAAAAAAEKAAREKAAAASATASAVAAAQPTAQPTQGPQPQEFAYLPPHASQESTESTATMSSFIRPARVEEAPSAPAKKSALETFMERRDQVSWSSRFLEADETFPNLTRLRRFLGK